MPVGLQDTPTLLSIPRWGELVGVHPLGLQGVAIPSVLTSDDTGCDHQWYSYAWQSGDRVSREDLAIAIQSAEAMITAELGFSPLPDWQVEEEAPHDQLQRVELSPWNTYNARGMTRTQTLRRGYFIGGGQKTLSVISAGAAITYTDPNGDLYFELATVGPIATSVTDPNEIALFYRNAETGDGAAAAQWEIRPIKVTIAGGFVTITFKRELAVLPDLLTVLEPVATLGTDNALFLTAVDVYRRYTDPTTSVQFQWLNPNGLCCNSCVACSYGVQTGCLVAVSNRTSIVQFTPATYADGAWTTAAWDVCRAPDRVSASYRAGYRDKSKARSYYEMAPQLERAVAYLSASLLSRPPCDCANVKDRIDRWRDDFAESISDSAGGQSWSVSARKLDNPFGTTRGAVAAWDLLHTTTEFAPIGAALIA